MRHKNKIALCFKSKLFLAFTIIHQKEFLSLCEVS